MSLSVERLNRLLTVIENGDGVCELESCADAIRELLAIKEAKPVGACEMEEDGHFCIATDSGYSRPPVGTHQLIIKPE